MAARVESLPDDTNRTNLEEVLRYLEEGASKDDAAYEATGDEQKRLDAAAKRAKAAEVRALLALRNGGAGD